LFGDPPMKRMEWMTVPANADTIERLSILTYTLLDEMHDTLSRPDRPDDVTLGMLMGLSMFLDEKIGPMRTKRLMAEAPTIVLKTDAHVTSEQRAGALPVLRAFGEHLRVLRGAVHPFRDLPVS
jgi:hypothetical protein